MTDKLEELLAERARQEEELEAFTDALRRVDAINVPESFYDELDAVCVSEPTMRAESTGIPLGLRA